VKQKLPVACSAVFGGLPSGLHLMAVMRTLLQPSGLGFWHLWPLEAPALSASLNGEA
jgi:hypothetical protein